MPDDQSSTQNEDTPTTPGSDQPNNDQSTTPPPQTVAGHMSANKIEAGLWISRIFTMFSCLMFVIPLFGGEAALSFYQRALISNCITSALRLYQRVPRFQLSRECLHQVFIEDSAHYLVFSLTFIGAYPITMVLMPIFLFAILHAIRYTRTICELAAIRMFDGMLNRVDANLQQILKFIALTEVLLMPACIFMIFSGKSSLLTPFIYYKFLTMRYASRRNPHNRQIFSELRMAMERICGHQSCPGFVRQILDRAIQLISRLAPTES